MVLRRQSWASWLLAYGAVSGGLKPDLPSTGPGIDDAWTKFPEKPFKSVTDTPGRGGDVNIVSGSAWPPYTPADQNPMLQELNKRLNVNLKLDSTTIQMAVVIVATLPILLVYPFLQKCFTKGVLTGAIKG